MCTARASELGSSLGATRLPSRPRTEGWVLSRSQAGRLIIRGYGMQDEILKGYLRDFSEQIGVEEYKESDQFERFANFCIVSKQYPREFRSEDLSVGGGGDCAIDGAAIIVNGNIVQSPEEVDFFLTRNGTLSVGFSFIQSKTSQKFNGAQIVNFLAGIKNFFSGTSKIPENEDIKRLRSIKDVIYKNSISLDKVPGLNLFFVTTGKWEEPDHILGLIKADIEEIKRRGLFSSVEFQCIDADRLKQMYREIRGRSLKEVDFPALVSLPEIDGVRQSFIGSLAASEYLKLITDEDGELQRNLFYDNVRDFQGDNPVNREIRSTLQSGQGQAALAIYNNGITIIAKKIERISDKVKLSDYQVVNGCQSSHVLYANRALIGGETHIVVKIIETTDAEIAANVIKATNRQTEVKIEAFESLSAFHKDLEDYYKARAAGNRLPIYYERRSKQYDNVPNVTHSQVITLSAQIKAFVSAHLAQPQSTHRYFGEILNSNREKMFVIGDSPERYYISALILNRVETLLRRRSLKSKYKGFKYHLVFMLYIYYSKVFSDNGRVVLNDIEVALDDTKSLLSIIDAASNSIEAAIMSLSMSREDGARSKAVTDILAKEMHAAMKFEIHTPAAVS